MPHYFIISQNTTQLWRICWGTAYGMRCIIWTICLIWRVEVFKKNIRLAPDSPYFLSRWCGRSVTNMLCFWVCCFSWIHIILPVLSACEYCCSVVSDCPSWGRKGLAKRALEVPHNQRTERLARNLSDGAPKLQNIALRP